MDPNSKEAKELSERVQVVVRCRPLSVKEKAEGRPTVVHVFASRKAIQIANPNPRTDDVSGLKTFSFDAVYGYTSTQKEIYSASVAPFVESVLSGYNATIFTYGQSGTGKTYTMEGLEHDATHKGLMPRCFDQIFEHIDQHPEDQYKVRCSYMQLYQDELIDLLGDSSSKACLIKGDTDVYIENLRSFECKTPERMKKIMRCGSMNRRTSKTKLNETSSRSHAIFMVTVHSTSQLHGKTEVKFGKLNLVDLAGSERLNSSQSTGQLLKETNKINLSLTTLGKVISALTSKKPIHIPYRDSKLTNLLRDSLGGNARTLMIANIGPAGTNYTESLNTLLYANRTKFIKNKPFTSEQSMNSDEELHLSKPGPTNDQFYIDNARPSCYNCVVSQKPCDCCEFCKSDDIGIKMCNEGHGTDTFNKPILSASEIVEKVKPLIQNMIEEKLDLERKMSQEVVGSTPYERLHALSYKMDLDIVMLVYRTNRYMIENKLMDIDQAAQRKKDASLVKIISEYNAFVKERFPKHMSPELLFYGVPATDASEVLPGKHQGKPDERQIQSARPGSVKPKSDSILTQADKPKVVKSTSVRPKSNKTQSLSTIPRPIRPKNVQNYPEKGPGTSLPQSQTTTPRNKPREERPHPDNEPKVECIYPTPSHRGQSNTWMSSEEENDRVYVSMPYFYGRKIVEGQRDTKFRDDVTWRYNKLGIKQYYIGDRKLSHHACDFLDGPDTVVKPETPSKHPLFKYLGNDRYAWYGKD